MNQQQQPEPPNSSPLVLDVLSVTLDETGNSISKGGVAVPFPWRLHECLAAVSQEGLEHIVAWQPHGRSFTVFQPKKFEAQVMPRFFGQTRYASFQRQLNIYGFHRFQQGKDKGGYFHLHFVRNNRPLVRGMVRRKIKSKQQPPAPLRLPIDYDEVDFYHSSWEGHNEPTIPSDLLAQLMIREIQVKLTDCNYASAPSAAQMLSSFPAMVGSLPQLVSACPPATQLLPNNNNDCTTQVSTGSSDDNGSLGSCASSTSPAVAAVEDGAPLDSATSALLQPTPLRETWENGSGSSTNMQLVDPTRNIFFL